MIALLLLSLLTWIFGYILDHIQVFNFSWLADYFFGDFISPTLLAKMTRPSTHRAIVIPLSTRALVSTL